MTLIKILAALIIFGLIILIHEFGHFIVARAFGVKVLEFSFGMGPRLFTIHGKKTDYSLKLFPIGGSCAMKGELNEDENDPGAKDSFVNKKPWQRLLVILAGPVFNFILAFITAFILVTALGSDKAVIASVMDGYPAQEAGIQAGDQIVAMNSRHIHLYREISIYNMLHTGKEVDIKVRRGSEILKFHIVPKYDEETGRYLVGMVSSGESVIPANIFEAFEYSYYELRYNILTVIDSLAYLVKGNISRDSVMGPVGIVSNISQTVETVAPYGLKVLLLTIADYVLLFSSNLGVMNLLPFPALDGGRILFILYEMITKKPVKREIEGYIHFAGFAILMLLMIFIAYNDIGRLL